MQRRTQTSSTFLCRRQLLLFFYIITIMSLQSPPHSVFLFIVGLRRDCREAGAARRQLHWQHIKWCYRQHLCAGPRPTMLDLPPINCSDSFLAPSRKILIYPWIQPWTTNHEVPWNVHFLALFKAVCVFSLAITDDYKRSFIALLGLGTNPASERQENKTKKKAPKVSSKFSDPSWGALKAVVVKFVDLDSELQRDVLFIHKIPIFCHKITTFEEIHIFFCQDDVILLLNCDENCSFLRIF